MLKHISIYVYIYVYMCVHVCRWGANPDYSFGYHIAEP